MKKLRTSTLCVALLYSSLAWGWSDPCFSPKGGCADKLISVIDQAQFEVYVLAYSFTHFGIAQALVRAKNRGLDVQIVINNRNRNERESMVPLFKGAGIPVTFDRDGNIMHNKVMIIDSIMVVQGSFNFTRNADLRNGENLNFIRSEPDAVKKYLEDFVKHLRHSHP